MPPSVENTHVVFFAADHGFTQLHSPVPFPREVIVQVVHNFLNTIITSAVTAALLELSPALVTGRGTRSDDETLVQKIRANDQSMSINKADSANGFDVLKKIDESKLTGIAARLGVLSRRRYRSVLQSVHIKVVRHAHVSGGHVRFGWRGG